MSTLSRPTRRDLMVLGAASGLSAAMTTLFATSARAGEQSISPTSALATRTAIGRATSKASGCNVNLVAIGNAPSAILNTLVAGGGTASYDVINIVGGMQKPLVDNDLIEDDRHG